MLTTFLSGRTSNTLDAYKRDLASFAAFMDPNVPPNVVLTAFLMSAQGDANQSAMRYRNYLLDHRYSPSTANRRMGALRSLIKMANRLGVVNWTLTVDSVKRKTWKDTRGPGTDAVRTLFQHVAMIGGARGARDGAVFHLLYDCALRRGEAVAIDMCDVDFAGSRVAIMAKGSRELEWVTLPEETCGVLRVWMRYRGAHPGPLFVGVREDAILRARLTGRRVHSLLAAYGKELGMTFRPHGLRHSAITRALDLTGGNVRAVQGLSRHKQIEHVQIYDDNRRDLGGNVARKVAADVITPGNRGRDGGRGR